MPHNDKQRIFFPSLQLLCIHTNCWFRFCIGFLGLKLCIGFFWLKLCFCIYVYCVFFLGGLFFLICFCLFVGCFTYSYFSLFLSLMPACFQSTYRKGVDHNWTSSLKELRIGGGKMIIRKYRIRKTLLIKQLNRTVSYI